MRALCVYNLPRGTTCGRCAPQLAAIIERQKLAEAMAIERRGKKKGLEVRQGNDKGARVE